MIRIVIFFLLLFVTGKDLTCDTNYVLIISVDGFRPEYLNRSITPHINSLATRGVKARLKNVFPTTACPNYISLFTGCYPENHGIISNVFKNTANGEYFDTRVPESYNAPKWYASVFLWEYLEKFSIYSSMISIPGASVYSDYKSSFYFIDIDEKVRPEFRIKEAFYYLRKKEKTPRLTAIRFEFIDEIGHKEGTITDKMNEAIVTLDNFVGEITDSLKSLNIYDKTDIIFLSVHGMTDINDFQTINLGEILYGKDVEIINAGSYAFLYCNSDSIKSYINLLNKNPGLRAFGKKEIPENLHLKYSPFIPDILVLPDYGKTIVEKNDFPTYNLKAIHGYSPEHKSMNGIFIAAGSSFKKKQNTEEVRIIDIFPLICKLFDVHIPKHTDGDIEKINKILK